MTSADRTTLFEEAVIPLVGDERMLTVLCWMGAWSLATVAIEVLSFLPGLAPPEPWVWRIGLGVPAAILVVAIAVVGPRLHGRDFERAVAVVVALTAGINTTLLVITPATTAVYFLVIITGAAAGFFAGSRVVLGTLAALTAAAIVTARFALPHHQPTEVLASWLVVVLPAMWGMAAVMFARRSELDRAIGAAREQARTDPLTGLGNRRVLDAAIEEHASGGGGRPAGLLLLDLDNFKSANTLYGHLGGDRALRVVADALRAGAPAGHLVARIGGDEIAVFAPGAAPGQMSDLAAGYRGAVRAANARLRMPGVVLDASVGIASHPRDGTTPAELLTAADLSMYAQKATRPLPDTAAAESAESPPTPVMAPPALPMPEPAARSPRLLQFVSPARAVASGLAMSATVMLLSMLVAPPLPAEQTLAASLLCVAALLAAVGVEALEPSGRVLGSPAVDVVAAAALMLLIAVTGGGASPAFVLTLVVVLLQGMPTAERPLAWRLLTPALIVLSPLLYDGVPGAQTIAMFTACYGCSLLFVLSLLAGDRALSDLERRVAAMAALDPMTGLPNRRAFADAVEAALGDGGTMAIVMLDLDDFSGVNTVHGHQAGDLLLREIAQALKGVVRDGDCIARVGGDEFAAVLPDIDAATATTIAERLVDAVVGCTAFSPDPARSRVSASAGYALHPQHGATADELMAAADAALMEVKRRGKGTAAVSAVVG